MMENLVSFCSAGLFFLIMNSHELKAIIKRPEQRTDFEISQVNSGLVRTLILEFFLLVPASVCLVVLMLPLILQLPFAKSFRELAQGTPEDRLAVRTLLGIASYGFPFAALRERVIRGLEALFSVSVEGDAHKRKQSPVNEKE